MTEVSSYSACQLLDVTVSGWPDKRIIIDNARSTLTVYAPTDTKPGSFTINYITNAPNCLTRPTIATYFCDWTFAAFQFRDAKGEIYQLNNFKVNYAPTGSLTVGKGNTPLSMVIGDGESTVVNVRDYYAHLDVGKSPIALFVRQSDGHTITGRLTCSAYYFKRGLAVDEALLEANLTLADEGTYIVYVTMPDGIRVICSQPVVVTKTKRLLLTIVPDLENKAPRPGETVQFGGFNLSDEYKAGVVLIDATGQRISLPVVGYDANAYGVYGGAIRLLIPETVKAGHYLYQITSFGTPVPMPNWPVYGHFVVAGDVGPLFSQGLSRAGYEFFPVGAAKFEMGAKLNVGSFGGPFNKALKLSSQVPPHHSYVIPLTYYRPYTGIYGSTAQLPDSVLPGDYTASLVEQRPDGTSVEGPPHLQTVRITDK